LTRYILPLGLGASALAITFTALVLGPSGHRVADAAPGCWLIVSTNVVMPHGGFNLTIGNAQPAAQYLVSFEGNFASTTQVLTTDSSGSVTSFENVDLLFGADSAQATGGSFVITAERNLPPGDPAYELCAGSTTIVVEPPTPTPTPTPVAVPPVVVLVHGIDPTHLSDANCGMSGPDSMEEFINNPSNLAGFQFSTECLIYRTREGVAAGANQLGQLIERVKRQRQVAQVDIVAHSMGGLVSRYYIEKLEGRGNVRSLTMLGTPNLGSNSAIPVCAFWSQWWAKLAGQYDQGACDMVPIVSPLLIYLNVFPGSHSGVTYNVLTGWLGRNPVVLWPNDCVVSVASAMGLAFPTTLFPPGLLDSPVLHVDGDLLNAVIGCGPAGKGEMNDPGVRELVAQILLESNGLAPALSASGGTTNTLDVTPTPTATPAAIPAAPAASTIASQSGIIAAAATADLPVAMPALQATGTFIFRAPDDPSAALTFELMRPGGTPVASTDGDVTYESGAGFGGLVETHYTIANPAEGTWTMRVTGTTVPAGGWPYDMQALVPGGISVTAGAGAGHYDTGTAIDLSADVAVNATPYAGASVNAAITKPDSSIAVVALTDAGGGSYTGSFGDTSACGLYQITVTADGTDSGTPFSRQDRTLAFVGVPGNVIMDPCVADSDADGLTDSDEINVYGTNPASADTDADMCGDAKELAASEQVKKAYLGG